MATLNIDYSGSGTTDDPYLVYTIAGLLYCIDQLDSIVLVVNDLDAKHDPTYREGIPQLNVKCSVLCGRAFPYDASYQYQIGDKCTFNDPDYGNRVYICKAACTGVSPTNTDYFTDSGSAYVRLIGFKVTGTTFITVRDTTTCTVTNIFIESGIHYKTSYTHPTFGSWKTQSDPSVYTDVYYNDCKFSMCIMFNGYACTVDMDENIHKNRCSEYYKFVGNSISTLSGALIEVFGCSRYSCTIEFSNCYFKINSSGYPTIKNASYCSFVGDTFVQGSTSNPEYINYQSCSNCFFSITVTGRHTTYDPTHRFLNFSGISIYNSSTEHGGPVQYNNYVIAATESQCKDKDWLISKGFIVG